MHPLQIGTKATPMHLQKQETESGRCGISIETLGDALPKEIARVRDQVLPAYLEIGTPGMFAVALMRATLDRASRAMIQGDTVAMIQVYEELKGFNT